MNKFLRRSKSFLNRNGSTILTYIGGAGVIATAVMAVRATPKALDLLDDARNEKGDDLTKLEAVKVAGPVYIPAIVVGASTIACIFGANILNKHQQATLMSAYALLDTTHKDYKNKVKELYGEEANEKVVEEIAKDKYDETDISESIGKQLFYDDFSGRYFESTMENVIRAQYAINRKISLHGGACLNEWYEELDIPPTEYGGGLGWSSGMLMDYQWSGWLEFVHKKALINDDLECYIITMSVDPMFDYEYY
jgi:hypothetical protein